MNATTSSTLQTLAQAETYAGLHCGKLSVMVVVGTRPEAIKMIPVVRALQESANFRPVVVSTGQHEQLVSELFREAGQRIDVKLHVARHENGVAPSLNEVVARIIAGIDRIWDKKDIPAEFRADGHRGPRGVGACLVHGDTSSAAAAALAAFNLQIPVVHVEAGLRTSNLMEPFPEEGNRQIISRLAAVHFAPTSANKANLIREGIDYDRIVVTGNTSIDMMKLTAESQGDFGPGLGELYADEGRRIVLVTAHRRENWGAGLRGIATALSSLSTSFPDTAFVVPMHPNPVAREPFLELLADRANVFLVEPREYSDFMRLIGRATLIITDSGGVQEEAPALGIPVLVTRSVTERSEGVDAGTLRLVGTNAGTITEAASRVLVMSDAELAVHRAHAPANPYGDGQASQIIVDSLTQIRTGGPMPAQSGGDDLRKAILRHMGWAEGGSLFGATA